MYVVFFLLLRFLTEFFVIFEGVIGSSERRYLDSVVSECNYSDVLLLAWNLGDYMPICLAYSIHHHSTHLA